MQLQFAGAAGTVTGSKTFLKCDKEYYLIDAGLFQGTPEMGEKNLLSLDTDLIQNLKGVFITHAHLDHCGYLPFLVAQGYSGPIFMTAATRELAQIVLEDAYSILQSELKEKRITQIPYSENDLARVFSMIVEKKKSQEHKHHSLQFKFIEAGHILGACSLLVQWKDKKILFSGDLGRDEDLVHVAPETCDQAVDVVILEGTYGGRSHSQGSVNSILDEAIEHVKKREGVLLIPCFAIARSAIVLKVLNDFFKKNSSKKLKIFVDSPMMIKALKVYLEYADQLKIKKEELEDILDQVKMVEFPKDRKKLSKFEPPFILVSSSGMLSGGRSVEHFERRAIKEQNYVLFVGYQGIGTLGRRVLDGGKSFIAYGREQEVKAQIGKLSQLSAHADEDELITYLRKLKMENGKVFVNHAEPGSAELMAKRISGELEKEVVIAAENMNYEL